MNIKISFENNDLASRSTAAAKREQVMPYLKANSVVSFEFKNVESISASYADELFGILTETFGLTAVSDRIKLINCNDFCAKEVAEAIFRRAEQEQPLIVC
ncbi:hypothetical protein NBRC116188_29040 [Oceaniserpentilla sp. 4NH20-0058]|uniref:STAS-like domain-containing protein n=1 Tax=Oceaniserpentilla sp. 4NH20-0058 TaxID=3127660 RepID=UPI003102C491